MPSKALRARTVQSRRRRLDAALKLNGMTRTDFAASVGVAKSHLSMVLNGQRESGRLTAKVDAYIAEHLPATSSAA